MMLIVRSVRLSVILSVLAVTLLTLSACPPAEEEQAAASPTGHAKEAKAPPPGVTATAETPARPIEERDVVFFKGHRKQMRENPGYLSDHPYVDVVQIKAYWPLVEPRKGVFDFSDPESYIDLWAKAGKKVLLRINPYGQLRGNDETPEWLKGMVPTVEFEAKKGGRVVIPKVWDEAFLREYRLFVERLAERYDGDERIAYVQIGVGHIGYTTAQPSGPGGKAFHRAGWSLPVWIDYVKKVIDIYASSFERKKLVLGMSGMFTRQYRLADNLDAGKEIAEYAVRNGCIYYSNGLEPNPAEFEKKGIPAIVRHLASLGLPDLTISLGDDFPLYNPLSEKHYRSDRDFQFALSNAYRLWFENDRKYTPCLVLLYKDLEASREGNPNFNRIVRDATVDFVEKVRVPKR